MILKTVSKLQLTSALTTSMIALTALASAALANADTNTSTTEINHNSADASANDNTETVSKTEINRIHVNNQDPMNQSQQPGTVVAPAANTDSIDRTVITEKQKTTGGLRDEAVGIKPQFGILSLGNANGSSDSRAVGGLTVDVNFLRRLNTEGGRPFLGFSFGALYSHVGNTGADFFGLNSPSGNNSGTNFLELPVNLKAGYTISDVFRPSVHGGANVIYSNSGSQSAWNTAPNIGLDLEFGIGKSVAFLIRPDWTLGADTSIFTGTLGLAFPIS